MSSNVKETFQKFCVSLILRLQSRRKIFTNAQSSVQFSEPSDFLVPPAMAWRGRTKWHFLAYDEAVHITKVWPILRSELWRDAPSKPSWGTAGKSTSRNLRMAASKNGAQQGNIFNLHSCRDCPHWCRADQFVFSYAATRPRIVHKQKAKIRFIHSSRGRPSSMPQELASVLVGKPLAICQIYCPMGLFLGHAGWDQRQTR